MTNFFFFIIFVMDIFVICSVYWPLRLPLAASPGSHRRSSYYYTISTYFPPYPPPLCPICCCPCTTISSLLLPLYLSANWVFTNYQMPPPRWVVKIGEEDDHSEEETVTSLSLPIALLNGQSTPHRLASSLSAPFTPLALHDHSNWRWTRPIGNK